MLLFLTLVLHIWHSFLSQSQSTNFFVHIISIGNRMISSAIWNKSARVNFFCYYFNWTKLLHGIYGFERWVLFYANCTIGQEILQISMGNELISIHIPSFRAFMCPVKFAKILKPLMATLHEKDHVIVAYIDDLYFEWTNSQDCKRIISSKFLVLNSLGFVIRSDKLAFTPNVNFWGFDRFHHND